MSDPQIIIDNLFTKLDQLKNTNKHGEIEQAKHALRVQLNNKKAARIPLTAREKAMLGPTGPVKAGPEEHGSPMRVLITVVVLAAIFGGIAFVAWPFVKGMMH